MKKKKPTEEINFPVSIDSSEFIFPAILDTMRRSPELKYRIVLLSE